MRPARVCLAALLAVLVAGCSSGSEGSSSAPEGPPVPPESAFAEGTCRTAAPDLRAVGQVLPDLPEEGRVDAGVKEALRTSQDRLAAIADGAEAELKPALDELVQKIGIVRIRADGNTYEAQFGEALSASYERVVEACTAAGQGAPARR